MSNRVDEVVLDGIHCRYVISWPRTDRVLVVISGTDIGEFADAPMVKLERQLDGRPPVELFIDARDVKGASVEVSQAWSKWLSDHQARFRRISMLTGTRYVEMTADFARRFAGLEHVMRIHTKPAVFDTELAAA